MPRPVNRVNRALARTITIGLDFGDDIESGWTLPDPGDYFALCRDAGFSAVRLAVVWVAHAAAATPYLLDATVLDRVSELVGAAVERGLAVVIDNHLDPELMTDPSQHRDRLLAVARQVAGKFVDAPETVMLEPLAESRDALDLVWNEYLADLVTAIREIDPARTLVVGPAFYNTALRLGELVLPADDNLILGIHQYWPIPFTMQGEAWFAQNGGWEWLGGGGPAGWLGTTWAGTEAQMKELRDGYDRIAEFATRHDTPVFIGEFGASANADSVSRATWARANRELAEDRGFSWGWWSLGPTFAVYDIATQSWDLSLLAALTG
jgi:endoglucanase